jgi:hypothetical protein
MYLLVHTALAKKKREHLGCFYFIIKNMASMDTAGTGVERASPAAVPSDILGLGATAAHGDTSPFSFLFHAFCSAKNPAILARTHTSWLYLQMMVSNSGGIG